MSCIHNETMNSFLISKLRKFGMSVFHNFIRFKFNNFLNTHSIHLKKEIEYTFMLTLESCRLLRRLLLSTTSLIATDFLLLLSTKAFTTALRSAISSFKLEMTLWFRCATSFRKSLHMLYKSSISFSIVMLIWLTWLLDKLSRLTNDFTYRRLSYRRRIWFASLKFFLQTCCLPTCCCCWTTLNWCGPDRRRRTYRRRRLTVWTDGWIDELMFWHLKRFFFSWTDFKWLQSWSRPCNFELIVTDVWTDWIGHWGLNWLEE